MSGSASRHSWTIGLTAAGALLLAIVPVGGAQAANVPTAPEYSPMVGQFKISDILSAHLEHKGVKGPKVSTLAAPADVTHIPSVCTVTGYAPTKLILGAATAKLTFSVKVTGCTPEAWAVAISPFLSKTDPNSLDGIATSDQPTITLSPKVLENGHPGKVPTGVAAIGQEDPPDTDTTVVDPAELDTTFTLLRNSGFSTSFNATPEPAKKGSNITVSGVLKRVSWDGKKLPYVTYSGQTVNVQFKATGATTYTTIKTVKSGTGGKVKTTVKAVKTGNWRLQYPGNSVTGASASTADNVIVK